jgi:hypothetical protein
MNLFRENACNHFEFLPFERTGCHNDASRSPFFLFGDPFMSREVLDSRGRGGAGPATVNIEGRVLSFLGFRDRLGIKLADGLFYRDCRRCDIDVADIDSLAATLTISLSFSGA